MKKAPYSILCVIILLSTLFIFFNSTSEAVSVVDFSEYVGVKTYYKIEDDDWVENPIMEVIDEDTVFEIKTDITINKFWSGTEHGIDARIDLNFSIDDDEKAAYSLIEGKEQCIPCHFWEGSEKCEKDKNYTYTWKIKPTGLRTSPVKEFMGIEEYNYFKIRITFSKYHKKSGTVHREDMHKTVFAAYITESDDKSHPGSEPGELNRPSDIHIGYDDKIYVADTGNKRIQVFQKDGTFVKTIGSINDDDEFYSVYLAEDGYIYTSETSKFDKNGKWIEEVAFSGGDDDVIVSSDGEIYTVGLYDGIQVLEKNETVFRDLTEDYGDSTTCKLDIGPDGKLYHNGGNIYIFYLNGTFCDEIDINCCDVKVTDDGKIYALQTYGILVYDSSHNYIKTIDIEGLNESYNNLILPSFDIDSNGDFYVADKLHNKVLVFNSEGKFLRSFGETSYSSSESSSKSVKSKKDDESLSGFEIFFVFLAICIFLFFKRKK